MDSLIDLSLNRPIRLFVDNSNDIPASLIQEFIRIRDKGEQNREAIVVGKEGLQLALLKFLSYSVDIYCGFLL